jgi:hypothetical protein
VIDKEERLWLLSASFVTAIRKLNVGQFYTEWKLGT